MSDFEGGNLSFANSEELERYIRDFKSYTGPEIYDFGSAVGFFIASLDNLRSVALEAELEDIGEYMSVEQIDALLKIAEYSRKSFNNQ